MDWDELAPLTNEQSQSITQLQQIITELSPIVPDIDKTKIEIVEPSELSSLPSNHKLRQRYKQIQLKQQKILESKQQQEFVDDGEESIFTQRVPKFDYVNYFMEQMNQERNTPLQLTSKLN